MNIPRDKRFYEHGEWIEILAEKKMRDLSDDVRRRFIRESIEEGYRREYYMALEWVGKEGPDWEDLTDEQRKNVRAEQKRHAQEMHEFRSSLA